jgi:predicted GNAT family N-acyltransferase
LSGLVTSYLIEPLGRSHDRSHFACGAELLDRYLKQQARQDVDKRVAAAFVLLAPPSLQVLGYYTLLASVVSADQLPADLARRVPRYPQLPVVLLGRLAVDTQLRGQKKGEFLLMDALRRSLEAASQIGAMAVVVDAKDDGAVAFYKHFGFTALQVQPARLFVSMKTVADLFG